MVKNLFIVFSIFVSSLAFASVTKSTKVVEVKGMVCSFCAQGIEKTFKKQSEVKDVDVSLEEHKVTIHFKKDKSLDDKKITELLKDAGYTVGTITEE